MEMVLKARLHMYDPPSHDKVYEVDIVGEGGKYQVRGRWGRRGKTMQQQIKAEGVSLAEAKDILDRLMTEKLVKGYDLIDMEGV